MYSDLQISRCAGSAFKTKLHYMILGLTPSSQNKFQSRDLASIKKGSCCKRWFGLGAAESGSSQSAVTLLRKRKWGNTSFYSFWWKGPQLKQMIWVSFFKERDMAWLLYNVVCIPTPLLSLDRISCYGKCRLLTENETLRLVLCDLITSNETLSHGVTSSGCKFLSPS